MIGSTLWQVLPEDTKRWIASPERYMRRVSVPCGCNRILSRSPKNGSESSLPHGLAKPSRRPLGR